MPGPIARLAAAPLVAALSLVAAAAQRAARALGGKDPVVPVLESDLVDALPISVALRDPESRFVQVNRTWERYFGIRREDAIGKRFSELPGWKDNPELLKVAGEAEKVDRDLMAQGPKAPPALFEDSRLGRSYLLGRQIFTDGAGRVTGLLATGVDTTELREAQRALAAERQRLDLLVSSTRAGFSEWDAETDVITYSERFKEMLGYTPDADTSAWRRTFDLMHPEDAGAVRDKFFAMIQPRAGAAAQESAEAMEYRMRSADGTYLWVRAEGLAERDGAGLTQRFITSYIDISALRNQVKFTNDVFDSVPLALAMRDMDGNYLFINRTWEKYFASPRETVIGHNVRERMTPAEAQALLALDRRAFERGPGAVESNEFDFRGKHLLQTRTAMANEQGETLGVLVATLDVSERRAIEEKLRDQMALTRSLIDENPNAMYLKDTAGCYVQVNDAWLKMVGVTRDQAIGRNVLELFREKESERYHAEDMRLIAQGEGSSEMESLRAGPGGTPQWVIIRKTVLRRANGEVVGLIGTNTDITYLKGIETALRESEARYEVAMRATNEGVYDWNVEDGTIFFSDNVYRVLGAPESMKTPQDWRERIHPEDRAKYDAAFVAHFKGTTERFECEYRYAAADGSWRWARQQGIALRDEHGRAVRMIGATGDITELKAAETELAERAKFIAELVDAVPISVAMRDAQGRYMLVNRTWERYFGVTRADALGKRRRELPGWPTDPQKLADAEEIERLDREMLSRRPDDMPEPAETVRLGRHYLMSRRALFSSSGEPIGVVSAGIDMTERRAMEERLRDQMALTQAIVERAPNAIFVKDAAGRYTMVNQGWVEMSGTPAEKALGHTVYDLYPPEVAKRFAAEDERLIAQGAAARPVEAVHRGPRSPDQWRMVRKAVLARPDGSVQGLIASSTDISELKRIEAELAAERYRLDLVVSATRAGIIDWNTATESAWFSERFKEMLGYPPHMDTAEWARTFSALVHPEDRDRSRAVFLDGMMSAGEPDSVAIQPPLEVRLLRADGSWLWVQSMGLTLRDAAGEPKRYLAAVIDITDRRQHDEALKETVRLREEVERMSRHDLKTPLNSVIAVSRLLREGAKLAPEDDELLSIVERAGYRILSMVNLSLDLFRMERGNYEFRPQAVDLNDIARKVAADLEGQAASKGVSILLRQSGSAFARAEELLTYSMLANIVKNAIEAEAEGGVVSVTIEGAGPRVAVHVHNAGLVPARVRERFFEKYATSGKSAGLGLGTYSAQLMARVQEGDITLHSTEADGTTVSVRLRATQSVMASEAHAPAATATRAERLPELPALRVLVVDDDEFNRLVLRRYLPTPPITLAMAVNGRAALDAARADWPDVVLLDLEMPVMDGYEAAAKLRAMEKAGSLKRCKIIAISSNDDRVIVDRALAAGCDHYLVKPAPRETLWALLAGREIPAGTPAVMIDAMESDAVEIDPDLEARLAEFLRSRREIIDEMPGALDAGDRVRFRKLAHKLAGSFALYGFKWASSQCRAIEDAALTGHPGELGRHVAAVRTHLETATIRIQQPKGRVAT